MCTTQPIQINEASLKIIITVSNVSTGVYCDVVNDFAENAAVLDRSWEFSVDSIVVPMQIIFQFTHSVQ